MQILTSTHTNSHTYTYTNTNIYLIDNICGENAWLELDVKHPYFKKTLPRNLIDSTFAFNVVINFDFSGWFFVDGSRFYTKKRICHKKNLRKVTTNPNVLRIMKFLKIFLNYGIIYVQTVFLLNLNSQLTLPVYLS